MFIDSAESGLGLEPATTAAVVGVATPYVKKYGKQYGKKALNWGKKKLGIGQPSAKTKRLRKQREWTKQRRIEGYETLCKGAPVNAPISEFNTDCNTAEMFARVPLSKCPRHEGKPGSQGVIYLCPKEKGVVQFDAPAPPPPPPPPVQQFRATVQKPDPDGIRRLNEAAKGSERDLYLAVGAGAALLVLGVVIYQKRKK